MTGKAESALAHLFGSAKALNAVSDEITTEIRDIETALAQHGIGVEAWTKSDTWREEAGDHNQYEIELSASIGYGKHNGKWGLLYSIYCDVWGEPKTSFLRDTARDVRISALEKLPELFDKLAEETQKLTEKANKNLFAAKAISSALKPNGRK